jgi:hypothetical protein
MKWALGDSSINDDFMLFRVMAEAVFKPGGPWEFFAALGGGLAVYHKYYFQARGFQRDLDPYWNSVAPAGQVGAGIRAGPVTFRLGVDYNYAVMAGASFDI